MIASPALALLVVLGQAPATASPAMETPAPALSATAAPGLPESVSPVPGPATPGPATPGPSPTPAPTPAPTPTPRAYAYRFVPHQPQHPSPGQPQIFAVYLNSNKLKSQGPIDIKVSTTPDVVKVLTRSNGREGVVPMIAPGDFEANSTLPKLPLIASGITTNLEFIAVGANGERLTVPVPITLQ